jgi:alcohol dehydrogenase
VLDVRQPLDVGLGRSITPEREGRMMKAVVFHGPGRKAWESVPDPALKEPTDAIVKMETTTICGTDLHILKGDVPAVTDGRILGHEGVGVVTEVGAACAQIKVGDRVIVSCISKCMECEFCTAGLTSHCQTLGGIGWIFGHLIDGTQAEYVRVPFADHGLIPLPPGVAPEQGTMLSDILPTGYEIGVLNGAVKEGDVVAVVGAGPVGLAAIMTARAAGAAKVIAVDGNKFRLEASRDFGATDTIDAEGDDIVQELKGLSRGGLGVDVAIEAVGLPVTFTTALDSIRPGGRVANVGVHGAPVTFPLERDWINNITITTGLVNATTAPELLDKITSGAIDPGRFITHRFTFDQFDEAYTTFANAAHEQALKVIITSAG